RRPRPWVAGTASRRSTARGSTARAGPSQRGQRSCPAHRRTKARYAGGSRTTPMYLRSPQISRPARSPALSSRAEQTLHQTAPASTASRLPMAATERRRQTKTMAAVTRTAPATNSPPARIIQHVRASRDSPAGILTGAELVVEIGQLTEHHLDVADRPGQQEPGIGDGLVRLRVVGVGLVEGDQQLAHGRAQLDLGLYPEPPQPPGAATVGDSGWRWHW